MPIAKSKSLRPAGVPARAWEPVPSYCAESFTAPAPGGPARQRIASARDAWIATSDVHHATQEHLIVFDLDVRHRIIARRMVGIGTLTGVDCHPREVFRQAIANGAAAILLVHNHPSGDCAPSRADLDLTSRLREVGELVGIPLLDHVVVATDGHTSISETWRP